MDDANQKPRKYKVTRVVHQEGHSRDSEQESRIIVAYDAQDAIVQSDLMARSGFPHTDVCRVEPGE